MLGALDLYFEKIVWLNPTFEELWAFHPLVLNNPEQTAHIGLCGGGGVICFSEKEAQRFVVFVLQRRARNIAKQ